MKTTQNTILTTLLVSTLAVGMTFAQGPGGGGRPPHGPPPGGGPGGPHAGGPGGDQAEPPVPPIVKALDKDADGSISVDEMKEAPE